MSFTTPGAAAPRRSINASAEAGEAPRATAARLAAEIGGETVLRVLACGPAEARADFVAALSAAVGGQQFPVTWLINAVWRGAQAFVVDCPVERIVRDGQVIGAWYDDPVGRWCILGELFVDDDGRDPDTLVYATFELAEAVLAEVGLEFTDVARTWLYVDKILDIYGELNAARRRYFRDRGVFEKLVPASTGIGVPNTTAGRLVMDVIAWKPTSGLVVAPPSPRQGSALEYGSAFSRAVEFFLPTSRELLISGTASIDTQGNSVHDTPLDQTDLTMLVVEGILHAACHDWKDVTRAVIYVKDPEAEDAARAWLAEHNLALPALWVESDICRCELLYEMEADAVVCFEPGAQPS